MLLRIYKSSFAAHCQKLHFLYLHIQNNLLGFSDVVDTKAHACTPQLQYLGLQVTSVGFLARPLGLMLVWLLEAIFLFEFICVKGEKLFGFD